jgi:hypothetical protein
VSPLFTVVHVCHAPTIGGQFGKRGVFQTIELDLPERHALLVSRAWHGHCETGQSLPGNRNFIVMLRIVVDHPLVGLLGLSPSQLLVAEADVELSSRAHRSVVWEVLQDPRVDLDRALQVSLDFLLVEAGLVELFGGLLGVAGRRSDQRQRKNCSDHTTRVHDHYS